MQSMNRVFEQKLDAGSRYCLSNSLTQEGTGSKALAMYLRHVHQLLCYSRSNAQYCCRLRSRVENTLPAKDNKNRAFDSARWRDFRCRNIQASTLSGAQIVVARIDIFGIIVCRRLVIVS